MNVEADAAIEVACTLTPEQGADRRTEFRALLAGLRIAAHREPRELRLWFDNGPGTYSALSDLLALENECCRFFTYTVVDEAPRGRAVLRVPSQAAERWLDCVEDLTRAGWRCESHI